MLLELEILNGILELEYDEYIYEYTVSVDDDINNLEFIYKTKDDCYVEIRNNKLSKFENIVYLDVYNVDELITYTFYVYKENVNQVNKIDTFKESLQIYNNESVDYYKVQLLCIGIFLCIVILFCIIFRRRTTIR